MLVFYRDLSGDQGRRSAIAIIQDLEKISCLRRRKWISEPIIEDEQLHTSEFGQKLWVGAVGMREHDLMQQARGALAAHGESLAASSVTQGAGQVSLSCASRTQDEDVEMTADPLIQS